MPRSAVSLLTTIVCVVCASAATLPDGSFCVDLAVERTKPVAWLVLDLAAGGRKAELGLSAARASLVPPTDSPELAVAAAGDALPAVGKGGSYRLFRLADRLVLERDGRTVVQSRIALTGPLTVTVRGDGASSQLGTVQPIEPPYCTDDFLRAKAEDSDWKPASGHWAIGVYRDPLVAKYGLAPQATWYESIGPGLSLIGQPWWCDLHAAVDIHSAGGATNAGVVFAAQGDRYGLFRLHGGRAEIVAVDGTAERLVAAVPYVGEGDVWVRLGVTSSGDRVEGCINGQPVVQAELPDRTSGRCGVWSGGGTVQFDSYRVEERHLLWGTTAQAVQPGQPLTWRLAPFEAGSVAGRAQLDRNGTAAVALRGGKTTITLGLTRTGPALHWSLSAAGTEVATGNLPGSNARRQVELLRRGPVVEARLDGRHLALWASPELPPCVAQAVPSAALSDVRVTSAPDHPDAELWRTSFDTRTVPGKQKDETWRVFGDILQPENTGWSQGDNQFVAVPKSRPAVVWYREPVPGDAGLAVDVQELSDTARLELLVNGPQGYALAVAKDSLQLTRAGQVVAQRRLAGSPGRARLWRDGDWVLAEADEQRLAWHDPAPLGSGKVGLRASGGQTVLAGLAITAEHGFSSTFGAVDTAWREQGKWLWNTGMACIAWSYWITGDGRAQPAYLWRREPLGRDVSLNFHVSEFTEGYESGELTHQHYHYHDVSVVLDGDGKDPDSGYRFLIGENGGHGIRLLRAGKSVAFNPSFTITMGDHCNTPRSIHTLALRNGRHLSLTLNDETMLSWDDPQPLDGGGIVALGVAGCRANYSDLTALNYRAP